MKCPFKKSTYINNTSFWDGYPQEQMITESFGDCEELECAMWNRSEKICGLPIIPSNIDLTKPILDQMDWRLP